MANPKDFDSDDIETAVSKPKKSRASPRPKSATKKTKSSRSSQGLPYKSGATSGSSSTRNARELWLSAVKNGKTIGSASKKGRRQTPTELWTESLRHSGAGITAQSAGKMDSFSGLSRSQGRNMAYSSTSHYLRQRAGTEKSSSHHDSSSKPTPGTPAYKSKEEYYDEVLDLKKHIQSLVSENSTQKSKIRRLEEDNIKKEKEIDQLLDPSKSEDLRRTLSDRRPDTSTVIHSLKQKVLKLEHQLKDKETSYNKLQSDLKTTKHEEVKIQMETLYKEVIRLNQLKTIPQDSQLSKTAPVSTVKETPSRMKALQDTIKRMNEKNVRLMSENKTLKEDLQKIMDDNESKKNKHKEYEDMSKKELMGMLSKLEKRLDRAETDTFSIMSDVDSRRGDAEGKIVLEGTVAQRLDQLDKRETELLEELNKQKSTIKRLQEDRVHYRKKNDEKEREIKSLKKEIEELQAELNGFYDKDRSVTPRRTPRQQTPRQQTPPRARSRTGSMNAETERIRKVEEFKQNRAAKQIQRGWRTRNTDQEEAAELIQGAIRGHRARQANMTRMRGFMAEPDDVTSVTVTATESELEDAADTIQTSIRGYQHQKKHLQRLKKPPISKHSDPTNDEDIAMLQASLKGHMARKNRIKNAGISNRKSSTRSFGRVSPTKRLDSEGEEEDEEIPPPSGRRLSGRFTPTGRLTPASGRFNLASGRATPQSGRATPVSGRTTPKLQRPSSAQRRTKTPPPGLEDSDSDDDIVMPQRKGKLF